MKTCRKCELEKSVNDFYTQKRVCKPCYNNQQKKYREENQEKIIEYRKNYWSINKYSIMEKKKEYLKGRRKNDNLFALKDSIKRNIRTGFLRAGFSKNGKTEEIIGCSFEEFSEYIESKFESWMSWDNRGLYNGKFEYGWDIDHIKPISEAKTQEDIEKLNHHTNLQPLCSKVNRDIKRDYY